MSDSRTSDAPGIEAPTFVQGETSRRTAHDGGYTDSVEPGDTLGRYQVVRLIGQGGMGRVFEGIDPDLARSVAIKVLYRLWQGRDTTADQQRLRREAKALAILSHPNVVQVYDVGSTDGHVWIAMELVQGPTLATWLDQPRTPAEILAVFGHAAQGLAAAHRTGLVHRDFKLTNVIVEPSGRARVLDFGLSTALQTEGQDSPTPSAAVDPDPDLFTNDVGQRVGTPMYMSPEQLHGGATDARSDQFSFCVCLHLALHGRYPPQVLDQSPRDMSHQIVVRAEVPPAVTRVLARGMAAQAERRHRELDEVMPAVHRAYRPWHARWPTRAGVATMAVGGLAWAAWPAPGKACGGAPQRVAAIWNVERGEQLERALVTDDAHSAQTWSLARGRFDQYARRWADIHRHACEAGRRDATGLDRRMACLDRGLAGLGGATEAIVQRDADAQAALEATFGLSPPERCLDPETFDDEPVPDDPSVAVRVELVRQAVARIDGMRHAGAYQTVLEQLDPVLAEAEALGYGPLVAEVLAAKAEATNGLRDVDGSRSLLERAYEEATSSGHGVQALRASIDLVWVVGVLGRAPDDAAPWVRRAEALLEREGGAPRIAAELQRNRGLLAYARGEYAVAIEGLERSASALEAAGDTGPTLGNVYNNLGVNRQLLGQLAEAAAAYQQALNIYDRAYGGDHPLSGQVLANLGVAQRRLGDRVAGRASLERSVEVISKTMGPDNPAVYAPLVNLGNLDVVEGHPLRAVPKIERAIAVLVKARGPDHPTLAEPIDALGNALAAIGRHEQAFHEFSRAVRLLSDSAGSSRNGLAHAVMGQGVSLRELGRRAEAQERLRHAVTLFESFEADSGPQGEARYHLALAVDDPDEARRLMGEALALFGEAEDRVGEIERTRAWLAEHPQPAARHVVASGSPVRRGASVSPAEPEGK